MVGSRDPLFVPLLLGPDIQKSEGFLLKTFLDLPEIHGTDITEGAEKRLAVESVGLKQTIYISISRYG